MKAFLLGIQWVLLVGVAVTAANADMVKGVVTGDGKPLNGVLVSDGCRIVRTTTDGSYQLPIGEASGHFVFVSLPRGYWSEEYFVSLERAKKTETTNFSLRSIKQTDRFDFVFLADMHLERRDIGPAKLRASLDEINRLNPQPAFLLFQGDICLQANSGDIYAECCKVARMPARHGAGNHEMMLDHVNPRDDFQWRFGPTYYSFNWGPLHCIVLDGNKPIAGQKGWKAVHGAVEGCELKWLEVDLAAQPKGTPIVIGVHIPIVSTYPERRSASPKDAPYWEMTNHKTLTDLLARYHVCLVLQGHMHENERITVDGVEYVESISISGCWWNHGKGFERGVDNSPRGYRIISVRGNTVTHRYQSTAESRVTQAGEFYNLDKPVVTSPKSAFVFNCYDAPNAALATARIDDQPWQTMNRYAAPSPATKGLTMPHHYRLITDTRQLDPGRHAIEVRVRYPNGQTVKAERGFSIAEAK